MTLVKICGMTRAEDVDCAVANGADMIGFVVVAWSPRAVDAITVRSLRNRVPETIETILVLANETMEQAAEVLGLTGCDRVQVYGPHAAATQQALGDRAIVARRLPDEEVDNADPILLDRAFGDEPSHAALCEHWTTVAALVESGRRVLLSGALTPDNVAEAVATAHPWAVDVARGVEQSPGIKDHVRLAAFMAATREARTA